LEKQKAAKILFTEGYMQNNIAKLLHVSVNTVNRWAISGKWKEQRINQSLLEDNSVQRILEMIDYQTKTIKKRIESWQKEDPDNPKLIERGDIDALQKLFTTIKRDSKKWSDYVSVIKEFFEFLQSQNLDIAKQVSDYGDKFLMLKKDSMS
jgi:hypothetical protein